MEYTSHKKFSVYVAVLMSCLIVAHAIECFKCISISGRLVACEEPLKHNDTMHAAPCLDQSPGTACIKISGVLEDTKELITVRSCGSYAFGLDDEEPDCGNLAYSDRSVIGCLHSCGSDACNSN